MTTTIILSFHLHDNEVGHSALIRHDQCSVLVFSSIEDAENCGGEGRSDCVISLHTSPKIPVGSSDLLADYLSSVASDNDTARIFCLRKFLNKASSSANEMQHIYIFI